MKEKIIIKLTNTTYTNNDLSKYIKELSPGSLVSIVNEFDDSIYWNCIYFPRGFFKNMYKLQAQHEYYHLATSKHTLLYHGTVPIYGYKNDFFYYGYKLGNLFINEQKKKIEISLFL